MKILMFGWEFPPFISGGLGTACHGLTKGLKELGAEIDFVLPRAPGRDSGKAAGPGTEIGGESPVRILAADEVDIGVSERERKKYAHLFRKIEYESILQPYQSEGEYQGTRVKSQAVEELEREEETGNERGRERLSFQGGYGETLMDEVFRLRAVGFHLGKDTDAQVIHAHDWMTFPAAIAAKKVSGLPLVVHIHATEYDRVGRMVYSQVYSIEQEGMREADAVVAVSQRTKDILMQYYDIPASKIRVVYNAVDKSDEGAVEQIKKFKEPLVLFLGRITSQKGPGYFLETARLILEKRRDIRFIMAGSGELLCEMIHLCAKMRLQDRFHFTGFLRGDDLSRVFRMSDVLVMTSVSEPFGIVPIEALKHRLPVIISRQSGVAEILPHAITVDFWDTELFAKSILDLLDNPTKKEVHLEENLKTLQSINWVNSAADLLRLYREVRA